MNSSHFPTSNDAGINEKIWVDEHDLQMRRSFTEFFVI